MSTNMIHWSNEWHTWLTIIGVTANRQCGCLVNSPGGKVESSPHCLSSSWEETLLLALSHPDISLRSNPHNRSQHSGQDSLIHTLMCPCTHQLLESNGNPNRQWHHVTMRSVLEIQPRFQKSWDAANKNGMWSSDMCRKTAQREYVTSWWWLTIMFVNTHLFWISCQQHASKLGQGKQKTRKVVKSLK